VKNYGSGSVDPTYDYQRGPSARTLDIYQALSGTDNGALQFPGDTAVFDTMVRRRRHDPAGGGRPERFVPLTERWRLQFCQLILRAEALGAVRGDQHSPIQAMKGTRRSCCLENLDEQTGQMPPEKPSSIRWIVARPDDR
jgi:hypothetical protein